MLERIMQKILSGLDGIKPLLKENESDGNERLWDDVTTDESLDGDEFKPTQTTPRVSTYTLPAPPAPPKPPVPPTPPEPPKAPEAPKAPLKTTEKLPEEKAEDPVYTASLVNSYSGGKMKLQVKNNDGTYSDWTANEAGSNDYSEYDMIMGFFAGTMKIVDSETGEEIDLNKIRDMFNGTIKPEKPKTESTDPDLTASNLDAYTGGKIDLYIKLGDNYRKWAPDAGMADLTEEEMIQMLFSGEAKMNYAETGDEVALNTIKDLFNGTLKPQDIKAPGVDVKKPAVDVKPENPETSSKPESFNDIFKEMSENVPDSTSTIEEKELALSYIERILKSDASKELKDYWNNKKMTLNNEIKILQAAQSGKPESIDTVWDEMQANVPAQTSTLEEKELALSYIYRILASDASKELKDYWENKALVITNEMKAIESVQTGKPESFKEVFDEMLKNIKESTSTIEEKELVLSYIQRILASDASQEDKNYWKNQASTIMKEVEDLQASLPKPEAPTTPSTPSTPSVPNDEKPTTPAVPVTPDGEPIVRTKSELKTILSQFGKSIDDSGKNSIMNSFTHSVVSQTDEQYTENQQTFTQDELLKNLDKLTSSSNPELAGIGSAISDVFKAMGIEIPDNLSLNSSKLLMSYDDGTEQYYPDIVMKAIMSAIKGEEIDPVPSDNSGFVTDFGSINDIFKQKGISVDDLMKLDKNGDGSIITELKELLTSPEFTEKLQFMINREKNHQINNGKINSLAHDNTLTVGEIAAGFGNNDIADLFKTSDGRVDRTLIIALGGRMSEDGNYTISTTALKKNLYRIDTDRDGIVTKEELEKYKQGEYYKKVAYSTMMSEIEKADGGGYDEIVSLAGFEAFKNSTIATPEQKDFASVINNITDTRLKQYIFESLGDGNGAISVGKFTTTIDADGDGIVTKQELQKYVDFVTQYYNVDRTVNYDRFLNKTEASKIEPFKSNPDIWYNFNLKDGCVTIQDVWNYVKTH